MDCLTLDKLRQTSKEIDSNKDEIKPTSHDPSVRLFEKAGYLTGEIRKNWVRKGSLWLDVNLMQKFSES